MVCKYFRVGGILEDTSPSPEERLKVMSLIEVRIECICFSLSEQIRLSVCTSLLHVKKLATLYELFTNCLLSCRMIHVWSLCDSSSSSLS